MCTISLLFSTGTALIAGDEEDLKASFKAALESLNTKDLKGFQKAEDTLQHLQDETEIPGAETSVARSSGGVVFPWTGLAHLDIPSLN